MRDYAQELKKRVAFIQFALKDAHCQGIVYGNRDVYKRQGYSPVP